MALAGMIRIDETALICDLAETYGILDYRALPLRTAAALACGLREGSRIRMKINEAPIDRITLLLAAAVDRLSVLAWMKTKDGAKGKNRPESIVQQLMKKAEKDKKQDLATFRSGMDFEQAWEEIRIREAARAASGEPGKETGKQAAERPH